MTLNQVIEEKLVFLQKQKVDSSRYELRLILAEILQLDVNEVHFYKEKLTVEQLKQFENAVLQRAAHCPADKIIGHKGFYKYDFKVNEDVLSPRPETELLVEESLRLVDSSRVKILELGVGSGCVLLSLLAELPQALGVGIDISIKALEVARCNAKQLKVEDRVNYFNLSWFDDDIVSQLGGNFDLIISNPPYIPSEDIASLDKEVRDFDPITALDGGADGLRDYRQIISFAPIILKQAGYLLFEVGERQAAEVVAEAIKNGLKLERIVKDLKGTDRCIILKK